MLKGWTVPLVCMFSAALSGAALGYIKRDLEPAETIYIDRNVYTHWWKDGKGRLNFNDRKPTKEDFSPRIRRGMMYVCDKSVISHLDCNDPRIKTIIERGI